jgi:hypothetical protein
VLRAALKEKYQRISRFKRKNEEKDSLIQI